MPPPDRRIEKTHTFKARDEQGKSCWVDEFEEYAAANPHETATGRKYYALGTGERIYPLSPTEFESGWGQKITRVDE